MNSAIIDNTALVYLTRLHGKQSFFDKLKSLLGVLYIPMEVKNEYAKGIGKEPSRGWLLNRLDMQSGFFKLCVSYDSLTMALITGHKGMDKGEAENYAQQKKINARMIISDDKNFTTAAKSLDPRLTIYSTLHIICWLDVQGYIKDWKNTIQKIHNARPFDSNTLREAYILILKELGISKTNKELSNKCSLKKLISKK